ncbi:MAG: hypothetical protein HN576_01840 [Bacteriovoracaceae bacterium]|jgi:hypothetical protein|nr:hypothetical protein [Bacteriovoracaceae bacterium]
MCDVCTSESIDWKFVNGETKSALHQVKLFRVYKDKIASIKLCHLHGIELFVLGETRFLQNHLNLARDLAVSKKKYSC